MQLISSTLWNHTRCFCCPLVDILLFRHRSRHQHDFKRHGVTDQHLTNHGTGIDLQLGAASLYTLLKPKNSEQQKAWHEVKILANNCEQSCCWQYVNNYLAFRETAELVDFLHGPIQASIHNYFWCPAPAATAQMIGCRHWGMPPAWLSTCTTAKLCRSRPALHKDFAPSFVESQNLITV